VRYERAGTVHSTQITPVLQTQGTAKVPVLGITPQFVHVGPITAARKTITMLGTFISGTASSIAHFPDRVSTIFSNHRDPNGAVGVIGISRVSGDLLSTSGVGWDTRIGDFLLLVAGVNLFVGVFQPAAPAPARRRSPRGARLRAAARPRPPYPGLSRPAQARGSDQAAARDHTLWWRFSRL